MEATAPTLILILQRSGNREEDRIKSREVKATDLGAIAQQS
ncbi:MAG TPA: hypothetical protein V6D20_07640 [Candidatus Obscuribacterales bacterium]